MKPHNALTLGILLVAGFASGQSGAADATRGVALKQEPTNVLITLDGQPFAEYVYTNTSRPFCYPIYGPGQRLVTRNWPMKDVPGEAHDHPHHKGMWFTHGAVNGVDFWSELPNAGKVVHQKFTVMKNGKNAGVLKAENQWVSAKGEEVCTDVRTLTFRRGAGNSRIIDFEIAIRASQDPVVFGDTKEGTMAIRLAESMRLSGGQNQGHIVNSRGVRDKATWGKRAEWCDYFGPVGGEITGVAIFDHPKNPRHPTWWHVRDYGLFAANPFGQHDFESLPDPAAGKLVVPKGATTRFKYRFLFHEGDEVRGNVAAEWERFSK